jgi:hypothetical protein
LCEFLQLTVWENTKIANGSRYSIITFNIGNNMSFKNVASWAITAIMLNLGMLGGVNAARIDVTCEVIGANGAGGSGSGGSGSCGSGKSGSGGSGSDDSGGSGKSGSGKSGSDGSGKSGSGGSGSDDSGGSCSDDPSPGGPVQETLRAKVTVRAHGLPKGKYFARIHSGGNAPITSRPRSSIGRKVEFEFDSNRDDVTAKAKTAIPPAFLSGAIVRASVRNAKTKALVKGYMSAECTVR